MRSNYEAFAQNSDIRDVMRRVDIIRAEKDQAEKNHVTVMTEYNKLANVVEDLTAENRHLRQQYGVPDNYGVDLE